MTDRSTTTSPTTTHERRTEIKDLVCEILEIKPELVSDTSLFKEVHGADSLRAIEILAALERTFRITIEQSELARMVNLDGVCNVVAEASA